MTLQQIVNNLPVDTLVNTPKSPFWYVRKGQDEFASCFIHERADSGDVFYDGNNGDRWVVRAVNSEFRRLIVENKSQGGLRLVIWE